MTKKPYFLSIAVYLDGRRESARFSKKYLEQLGALLAKHFSEVTGLALNRKCWFTFNVGHAEIKSFDQGIFKVVGEIIGANSVGYPRCEVTWQEQNGLPIIAGFSRLPLRALVRDYADLTAKEIPLPGLSFRIEWIPFWESHLPDFFLEVQCESVPRKTLIAQLETEIGLSGPSYYKITRKGKRLNIHIDFGLNNGVQREIQQLLSAIDGQLRCKILAVTVGPKER